MYHSNGANSNPLTNKVKINLYVFGALILHRVRREIHYTDMITTNDRRALKRNMQLLK
jgi:hypothetical protein